MEPAQPAIRQPVVLLGRPTRPLPLAHLVNLSVYWMGMSVIGAGLHFIILPKRIEGIVGLEWAGIGVALVSGLAVIVAMAVQPTVGAISDFTISRWGRRKPYIFIGTTLDIVFLWAIASSETFIALVVFLALLQFSSNFAQGPFQGYVPDLVPAPQVGMASGLMGVMIILGQMTGVGIAAVGLAGIGDTLDPEIHRQAFFWPTVALGVIELATMLLLVATIHEGRAGPSRAGRSWLQVARAAWSTDILQQRSFIWLLGSRLLYLAVPTVMSGFALFYLQRSLGLSDAETGVWFFVIAGVMGGTTALATLPAARYSDRVGRKRMIYASFALAAVGMTGIVAAPNVVVTLLFLIPVGISAGAFLAVDWALMTDIIPKATAGRYMGISNVATAAAGPLGLLVGGVALTGFSLAGLIAEGPRAAMALTLIFLVGAALTLRNVEEHRRED